MDFQNLIERVSNPLRKKSLSGVDYDVKSKSETITRWKEYILHGDITDPKDQKIKDSFLHLQKTFPQRAESWLNQQATYYSDTNRREKTSEYTKIYEDSGIQVFLDNLADSGFIDNVYKMRMLKFSLKKMLLDTRGILPNRKPRFVITNGYKNQRFNNLYTENPPAIYRDRIIFIDENAIDNPNIFIHEYAHFVADLISKQTEPILQKSYNELLDSYWRRAKKKKVELQGDPDSPETLRTTQKWREKISTKLGFPQYGLTNFDEFFAVLIENWKLFPSNAATYRFKTLVKDVLNRL